MKKLILLFIIPLTIFCQMGAQKNELGYAILTDKEIALKYKDSLVNAGWVFQEKFPFFYKTVSTAKAPKSCSFSPDDSIVAVTLLSQKNSCSVFRFRFNEKY